MPLYPILCTDHVVWAYVRMLSQIAFMLTQGYMHCPVLRLNAQELPETHVTITWDSIL
jgi:hypothetical protein